MERVRAWDLIYMLSGIGYICTHLSFLDWPYCMLWTGLSTDVSSSSHLDSFSSSFTDHPRRKLGLAHKRRVARVAREGRDRDARILYQTLLRLKWYHPIIFSV